APHDSIGRLADHDRARLGELLESTRDVRRITDGGVVHPEVVADLADDDETGIHADPDLELLTLPRRLAGPLSHRALDAERGQYRAACVILPGERRAEERHEAVAEKLVDGALVAVDFAEAHLEEPFQQTVHRFGPEDLGEWRRIGEVAEENRHLL